MPPTHCSARCRSPHSRKGSTDAPLLFLHPGAQQKITEGFKKHKKLFLHPGAQQKITEGFKKHKKLFLHLGAQQEQAHML